MASIARKKEEGEEGKGIVDLAADPAAIKDRVMHIMEAGNTKMMTTTTTETDQKAGVGETDAAGVHMTAAGMTTTTAAVMTAGDRGERSRIEDAAVSKTIDVGMMTGAADHHVMDNMEIDIGMDGVDIRKKTSSMMGVGHLPEEVRGLPITLLPVLT